MGGRRVAVAMELADAGSSLRHQSVDDDVGFFMAVGPRGIDQPCAADRRAVMRVNTAQIASSTALAMKVLR